MLLGKQDRKCSNHGDFKGVLVIVVSFISSLFRILNEDAVRDRGFPMGEEYP